MANLLLVEDDASVRRLVTLQLSLVGYDVCAAEDAEAVAAVSEEAPAAAAVPAGAGKTKIKDYLVEIVLFFMLILLHHTAS